MIIIILYSTYQMKNHIFIFPLIFLDIYRVLLILGDYIHDLDERIQLNPNLLSEYHFLNLSKHFLILYLYEKFRVHE